MQYGCNARKKWLKTDFFISRFKLSGSQAGARTSAAFVSPPQAHASNQHILRPCQPNADENGATVDVEKLAWKAWMNESVTESISYDVLESEDLDW